MFASFLFSLRTVKEHQKEAAIKKITAESTPDSDYYAHLALSAVMISLGLLLSDQIVIIGGILLTPVLYPVLGLGLAFSLSDFNLVQKTMRTIFESFLYYIFIALLVALFFGSLGNPLSAEVLSRSTPSLLYIFIAIAGATAASIALVKGKEGRITLASAAMAVSLIPPAVVIGISLATFAVDIARGSFLLLLINLLGVIIASTIIFSLFNFGKRGHTQTEQVQKKDTHRKQEKSRSEKQSTKKEIDVSSYEK